MPTPTTTFSLLCALVVTTHTPVHVHLVILCYAQMCEGAKIHIHDVNKGLFEKKSIDIVLSIVQQEL